MAPMSYRLKSAKIEPECEGLTLSDSHVRRDVKLDKRKCIEGSKYIEEIMDAGGRLSQRET